LILALLLWHVLGWSKLKVDNITLILVGALLVVPLFDSIRKIKLGEFEAEIAPKEVDAAVAKASGELPSSPTKKEPSIVEEFSLVELVRRDPQLVINIVCKVLGVL
jgi:hypothetical protein